VSLFDEFPTLIKNENSDDEIKRTLIEPIIENDVLFQDPK